MRPAGWTLAPARLPMAASFHGGQVKFVKYQPDWAGTFFSPKVKQIPDGQIKGNFGLVTFKSYQPDWLVPEKAKIQPWVKQWLD